VRIFLYIFASTFYVVVQLFTKKTNVCSNLAVKEERAMMRWRVRRELRGGRREGLADMVRRKKKRSRRKSRRSVLLK